MEENLNAQTLSSSRRELLDLLLREAGLDASRLPIPRRSPEAGPPPLSYSQQRLWFLEQLEPGRPTYNLRLAVMLTGAFEPALLQAALDATLRRHEVLRTSFHAADGEPVQRIESGAALPLNLVDLAGLPAEARTRLTPRLLEQAAQRPFDLRAAPLLRVLLVRLGPREHLVALTMHHIISDAWSMGVLMQELTHLYRALAAGRPASLPELPIQFADFAAWQRRRLAGSLDGQLAFWQRYLEEAPQMVDLPSLRPRPAVPSPYGAYHSLMLDRRLTERITALGQRSGATLFMILSAAVAAWLHRYTGQESLLLGFPTAGRDRPETERLIGFFINTLVLRCDLGGDPPFRELIERVRVSAREVYAHQEVPFERLVQEVQAGRDLGRSPLFQVMLNLLTLEAWQSGLPTVEGLDLRPIETPDTMAKFDLTIHVTASARDTIHCYFVYARDLFEPADFRRLEGHFEALLTAAVAEPRQRISDLPLLTAPERHQVTVEWNDPAGLPVDTPDVLAPFRDEVRRGADRVALIQGERRWTFGELSSRAAALERSLRRHGAGPGSLAGLLLLPGAEWVAAQLAVLAAGGGWLALDPRHPRKRLELLLDAARPGWLVAAGPSDLAAELAGSGALLFLGSLDASLDETGPGSVPPLSAAGDGLAYVAWTSGSTGAPKGVLSHRRGVASYLAYVTAAWEIGPGDVVLQMAAPTFDASVRDTIGPLRAGACVVLPDPAERRDPRALLALIRSHRVTALLSVVPSMLEALTEAAEEQGEACPALRLVLVSGELFAPALWERARTSLAPAARFVNQYGPTECTMTSTYHRLREGDEALAGAPVGRPIPGMRAHVLDRGLRLLPLGVPGEICLGGAGLAWGYLGQPGATAERFVPDPVSGRHGDRLYRTGDLGRFRQDGSLELLGRLDHQVKVRGYRVEPGEIEGVLCAHPGVRQAVVTARDAGRGPRLVAYVVAADGAAAAAELREHLRRHLPEPLIPSSFLFLEQLPVTPHGKVDRQALPVPEEEAAGADAAPLALSPLEEVVAGIWGELLHRARIEPHDSFFDLGGHSLLATQAVARIRRALGIDLPLRRLFEAPTLRELTAAVEEEMSRGLGIELPPLVPGPRSGPLPLSYAQERLWFLDRLEPGNPAYNMRMGLHVAGRLDLEALQRAFAELIRRHESLRTVFAEVDGQPAQTVLPAGPCELPVVDLAALPPDSREAVLRRLIHQEALLPFDLLRGPLLRTRVVRLAEAEVAVLATVHHIVSDAWSVAVLVREVGTLYNAFAAGQPSPLPDLPVQYADFSLWQRSWLTGEVLAAQLDHWRRRLDGMPDSLALPTDRARPPVQTHRGDRHWFAVPAAPTLGLRSLVRATGATLFMGLFAAFAVLLRRCGGQDDIVIGTHVAGRGRAELERVIGFFINNLVLRLDLSGDPDFREVVRRAREVCLSAYMHQDLPFGTLVQAIRPQRDPSRTPLFQVLLVLQNAPVEKIGSLEEGTRLRSLSVDAPIAKFDLTLFVYERGPELVACFEYNTDLFVPATIERLAGQLQDLLARAVAAPEAPVSTLVPADREASTLLDAFTADLEDL